MFSGIFRQIIRQHLRKSPSPIALCVPLGREYFGADARPRGDWRENSAGRRRWYHTAEARARQPPGRLEDADKLFSTGLW